MNTLSVPRHEVKIETFNTCVIDTATQQREISQIASEQTQYHQTINTDSQENHDTTSLNQQQQGLQQQDEQGQTNQLTHIHSNNQQNMTLTPIRLSAILDGEFFTVIRVEDSNVTARCLQCQKLLNGNLKSTGNFLCHIKREHPFMIDKIKCKSNQRKPAMIHLDLSANKCPEIVRTKKEYKKYYKTDDWHPMNEEASDQFDEWTESSLTGRRKIEEAEYSDLFKVSQNDSYVAEDEFDAIGRNVAAKLRNMRLDQRILAEKLLSDILFEAQLGDLHIDSKIQI